MKRKAVLAIMLTLLFMGILSLTFEIQPVKAFNIGSDYTFTSDISDSIVVTADNIIIDGAGYTVQGNGTGTGIDLSDRNNVTLKNVEVTNFDYGIYLFNSINNNITGNTVSNNDYEGIHLWSSSNNAVSGNTASSNNEYGIRLHYSSNNAVSGNTASNNEYGIRLWSSSNNAVSGNTASSNNGYGIFLGFSSNNNAVSGNTASNNEYGIYLYGSSNNAIFHNNFMNNTNQAFVTAGYTNIWDVGYPSGGNYWSDYEETYPNATEIDGSGIWDTPYVIDENNQDNYPIVPEFPSFLILPLFMTATLLAVIIIRRKHKANLRVPA